MMSLSRALVGAYFDPTFYLSRYEDVKAGAVDPLCHYLEYGFREDRDPAPWFSTAIYRTTTVVPEGEDPFVHFLASNREKADQLKAASVATASAPDVERWDSLIQPFFSLRTQTASAEVVIFTSIAGDRHLLPSNTTQHSDQRIYGDKPFDQPGWSFHPAMYWDLNPKLAVLFHKYCLPSFFCEGTKLIWIDSRVSLQTRVIDRISAALSDADLCLFGHYERDCVYDELGAIVRGGRASLEECRTYEAYLSNLGFRRHAGLYETGAMGVRVTAPTCSALRKVFALCKQYVARDQVILPTILDARNIRVAVFNDGRTNLRNSPGVFVHSW